MMKLSKIFSILLLVVMVSTSGLALAASTTTQTVTIEVTAVNDITVSGDPASLVATATTPATDGTTSYGITTNGTALRITGQLDTLVPTDTTLTVELAAPTAGGVSAGPVALTDVAQDLVTGINATTEAGLGITYNFSALPTAGVVASQPRIVTFTITN